MMCSRHCKTYPRETNLGLASWLQRGKQTNRKGVSTRDKRKRMDMMERRCKRQGRDFSKRCEGNRVSTAFGKEARK